MILVVWIALIVLTTFYCYFCEQRLFPKNALRMGEFSNLNEEGSMSTDDQQSGHLHANMAAALPKSDYRQSRKEVITVVLDFIETNCFKLSGKIAVLFLANLHDRFV